MEFSTFLRRSVAVLSVLLFGLQSAFVSAVSPKPQSAAAQAIEGRYIVLLKQRSTIDALLKKHGIASTYRYEKAVHGFAAKLSEAQLEKLKAEGDVELIEPDYVVTTFAKHDDPRANFDWDKFFRRSSSSRSSSSSSRPSSVSSKSSSSVSSVNPPASSASSNSVSVPTGVNRVDADLSATAWIDGKDERVNVDIAIIDTGIDLDHPDLNVYRNVNTIKSGQSGDDDNGHGSHVAGIAAAKDDGKGVVGVAPGARLWAVKVLGSNGSGQMSDIIEGIDYVTQHADEIEVANMSLGCSCSSSALNQAIDKSVAAGVVYAVAAGNSSKDAQTFGPANHPSVISVSSIADFNGKGGGGASSTCRSDVDDSFSDFSNYGSVVDIAAPGTCIYSTSKNGGYATLSGTSMASPHVAGAAALYVASHQKPGNAASVNSVKAALLSAAFSQSGSQGFSGDPDGSAEPVLNVGSF